MNESSLWVCQNNLMHIKEAFQITYKFNFEWKLKSAMINTSLALSIMMNCIVHSPTKVVLEIQLISTDKNCE